jgi:hypothetical protein
VNKNYHEPLLNFICSKYFNAPPPTFMSSKYVRDPLPPFMSSKYFHDYLPNFLELKILSWASISQNLIIFMSSKYFRDPLQTLMSSKYFHDFLPNFLELKILSWALYNFYELSTIDGTRLTLSGDVGSCWWVGDNGGERMRLRTALLAGGRRALANHSCFSSLIGVAKGVFSGVASMAASGGESRPLQLMLQE